MAMVALQPSAVMVTALPARACNRLSTEGHPSSDSLAIGLWGPDEVVTLHVLAHGHSHLTLACGALPAESCRAAASAHLVLPLPACRYCIRPLWSCMLTDSHT